MKYGLAIVLLFGAILGYSGLVLFLENRTERCAYVPLLGHDRLGSIDYDQAQPSGPTGVLLPPGWSAAAKGVQIGDFAIEPGAHSLQLIGIANYVQTPGVTVQPGAAYCFVGQAIADSASATRLQVVFRWLGRAGQLLAEDSSGWQPIAPWRQGAPDNHWSRVGASFLAPDGAQSLAVRLQPASDDRIYLDDMHIRAGGGATARPPDEAPNALVTIAPWPNGYRAALSFSFDWETAMGGLIHSRSDDPNGDNPLVRAGRMREGITTTLDLFRPYGIRATYYTNGYNFLLGNTEKRQFMGNPTYSWATQENGWTESWASTPWFSRDPYATAQSQPGWYFGDLVPLLQRERQDIQSHTFSHFDAGRVGPDDWRADLETWRAVAAERGVPMARSVAFPWSSSAGMSDASWQALEQAGITSVTRTNWRQRQYMIVSADDPHCRPIPGHERIVACPDFYLTTQSAAQALKLIDHTLAVSGTLDLWAHTEEVTSPDQIAAWGQVVAYAAQQRDAGTLWIAPLAEIADWQQAIAQVRTKSQEPRTTQGAALNFAVINGSQRNLNGLTLALPFKTKRVTVNGSDSGSRFSVLGSALMLNINAGETVEVQAWPA